MSRAWRQQPAHPSEHETGAPAAVERSIPRDTMSSVSFRRTGSMRRGVTGAAGIVRLISKCSPPMSSLRSPDSISPVSIILHLQPQGLCIDAEFLRILRNRADREERYGTVDLGGRQLTGFFEVPDRAYFPWRGRSVLATESLDNVPQFRVLSGSPLIIGRNQQQDIVGQRGRIVHGQLVIRADNAIDCFSYAAAAISQLGYSGHGQKVRVQVFSGTQGLDPGGTRLCRSYIFRKRRHPADLLDLCVDTTGLLAGDERVRVISRDLFQKGCRVPFDLSNLIHVAG